MLAEEYAKKEDEKIGDREEGVFASTTDDEFGINTLHYNEDGSHYMAGQLMLQPWRESPSLSYCQNTDLSLTFSINLSPHFIGDSEARIKMAMIEMSVFRNAPCNCGKLSLQVTIEQESERGKALCSAEGKYPRSQCGRSFPMFNEQELEAVTDLRQLIKVAVDVESAILSYVLGIEHKDMNYLIEIPTWWSFRFQNAAALDLRAVESEVCPVQKLRICDPFLGRATDVAAMDFAYDGEKSLFTLDPLPRNKLEFTIVLEDVVSSRYGEKSLFRTLSMLAYISENGEHQADNSVSIEAYRTAYSDLSNTAEDVSHARDPAGVGGVWLLLLGGQTQWTVVPVATLISISSIIAADTYAFVGGKFPLLASFRKMK
ncbi:hypothetical protein RHMOL_Rhmol09G0079800 [Rhododendron molle]|uniref:Uncharacterized protein n=1 Tax=Rhododendron molle TaxID=49168 RepID=A0ACC0MC50_RHOML|nr:hypothetical protein RHMOL_Rhmol09G0079800 [Rhododendron molle]